MQSLARVAKDKRMTTGFLIVAALISGLLVCACSVEQTPEKVSLELGFIGAAMDMVIDFNHSTVRGTTLDNEIPKEFWVPEIEDLKPLKVYWHNNNLAIILSDSDDETDGIYIHVPISSYIPMGDTIELTFGQESYTFRVATPDLTNTSLD